MLTGPLRSAKKFTDPECGPSTAQPKVRFADHLQLVILDELQSGAGALQGLSDTRVQGVTDERIRSSIDGNAGLSGERSNHHPRLH